MKCKHCGQEITDYERTSRDFCDDVCRTEYHNKRRKIDRKLNAIKKNFDALESMEFSTPSEQKYIKNGIEARGIATEQSPTSAFEVAQQAYSAMRVLVGIASTSDNKNEVSEATYALNSLRKKLTNFEELL